MKIDNHHAYVFEGNSETIIREIKSSIGIVDAMDIFEYIFDNFSIDDARMIKELDIKSPIKGDKKYIFLILNSISREAQNALLKVFEDPSLSTIFFIVVPNSNIFIETVLSRVEVIRHESYGSCGSPVNVELFLESSVSNKLEIVANLLKDLESEKIHKQDILNFIISIKNNIEKNIVDNKKYDEKLLPVLNSLKFSSYKSCSLKLLLERICLC